MFKVKQFEVCRTTGITSFELEWDLLDGHGLQNDKGAFLYRSDAERRIESTKRSYIILLFEKYVLHAKVLIDTGKHDFYKTSAKLESLDRCSRYMHWFQDKPLDAICRVIVALEDDLCKILPTPANPSYHSSEERILDMVVFAKKENQLNPKLSKSLVDAERI
jgi:hypothetical protein